MFRLVFPTTADQSSEVCAARDGAGRGRAGGAERKVSNKTRLMQTSPFVFLGMITDH